jgi:hypothetical protein
MGLDQDVLNKLAIRYFEFYSFGEPFNILDEVEQSRCARWAGIDVFRISRIEPVTMRMTQIS